jgi:DNA-binding NarL/FixJ family response regulator
MRVALVGPASACARLRAEVAGTFEVVGAFADLASARAAAPDADAFLIAAETHRTRDDLDDLIEPLTERETQVLELLAEGLSNKGIAARLGISDQTVKFHVASICGKLDAHTRTEAVRRAVRQGLITL